MRSEKKPDRLFVYIVISLLIHLVFFYLFPLFNLNGVVNGEGNAARDFGFVQLVEFKPIEEPVKKPVKPVEQKPVPEQNEKKPEKIKPVPANSVKVEEPVKQPEPQVKEEPVKQDIPVQKEPVKPEPQPEVQQEVVTSENSDLEVKIDKEQEKQLAASVDDSEKSVEEAVPEEKTEVEPTPPPPPTAGDLISLLIKPVYPKYLVGTGKTGVVELIVHVGSAGEVGKVEVDKSSQEEQMDNIALNTVKHGWKFQSYQKAYSVPVQVVFDESKVEVKLGKVIFK